MEGVQEGGMGEGRGGEGRVRVGQVREGKGREGEGVGEEQQCHRHCGTGNTAHKMTSNCNKWRYT